MQSTIPRFVLAQVGSGNEKLKYEWMEYGWAGMEWTDGMAETGLDKHHEATARNIATKGSDYKNRARHCYQYDRKCNQHGSFCNQNICGSHKIVTRLHSNITSSREMWLSFFPNFPNTHCSF